MRAIAGTIALVGLGLFAAQANKLAAGDLCYTTVMKYRAGHHESRFPAVSVRTRRRAQAILKALRARLFDC